jgi:hypothetical protein
VASSILLEIDKVNKIKIKNQTNKSFSHNYVFLPQALYHPLFLFVRAGPQPVEAGLRHWASQFLGPIIFFLYIRPKQNPLYINKVNKDQSRCSGSVVKPYAFCFNVCGSQHLQKAYFFLYYSLLFFGAMLLFKKKPFIVFFFLGLPNLASLSISKIWMLFLIYIKKLFFFLLRLLSVGQLLKLKRGLQNC